MRRTSTKKRQAREESSPPKHSIAVASDLSGVPRQQLPRMEESGLFHPGWMQGNTRRYSATAMDSRRVELER
jgi:hypothetical protein